MGPPRPLARSFALAPGAVFGQGEAVAGAHSAPRLAWVQRGSAWSRIAYTAQAAYLFISPDLYKHRIDYRDTDVCWLCRNCCWCKMTMDVREHFHSQKTLAEVGDVCGPRFAGTCISISLRVVARIFLRRHSGNI